MKKAGFVVWVCVLCSSMGLLYGQADSVLFRIGTKTVSKKEAFETLGIGQNRQNKEMTIDQFNRILNFYLSIYDFKQRHADTTYTFKRKLESQFLTVLGSVYSAENHEGLINKCMDSRKSYAVIKDLFVPFIPMLLKDVENLKSKGASMEEIAKYAESYEGTHFSVRIIAPTESNVALNNATCELLEDTGKIVGPVKDLKGYHYIQLEREQKNFGRYKVQLIYVAGLDGKEKINKAYKELTAGVDFTTVVKKYSEDLKSEEDNGIRYFVPSVSIDEVFEKELNKLVKDEKMSLPFFASEGWYILKRLEHNAYPSQDKLKKHALRITQKPSFFIEELKKRYNVKEYPYNFLSGKNDILFLVATKAYYSSDLEAYAKEYGYTPTIETYDYFLYHILVEKYRKELDNGRYQRLIDDFYFMQIYNPMLAYEKGQKGFEEGLRKLVKKYNPEIQDKKYVENNPIFED
ncbi:MAG: peptidylprolyl isomerase [Flavobacteriaceae bacterium]|nr:peptidylprolyl isomerase [Flavobacteriaceae bacterium]